MTPEARIAVPAPFRPAQFVLVLASLGGIASCGGAPPPETRPMALVERRDIVVTATAAGLIEPITTVEVKSKASGEIIEVLVEEGEEVEPGQLLVRVDPRIPTNAVMQAEADSVVARAELDNAESQLTRSRELFESQAITATELEGATLARATAYAALIRARRTLEDAQIALEDTEVRSPDHGIILQRAVEVGSVIASASQNVSGGAVLLRMARLDTVQVRAMVDETDIGMVAPEMPVSIQVAAYPNRPFRGNVLRVGAEAVALQNVTMFPVIVRIANSDRLLRPGMNAEVEVHIGEARNTLAVPNNALRTVADATILAEALDLPAPDPSWGGTRRPPSSATRPPERSSRAERNLSVLGGRYVAWALRNGTPTPVLVEAGLTDFDYTAVDDALREGEQVLLLPTLGLLEEQQNREEWARRRAGTPLGGTP